MKFFLANRRLQPLGHLIRGLVSTAYRTTRYNLAKWWPAGRGGRKTAAFRALGNNTVAKFQMQLLPIRFRFSQFFDPRLYLLYCIEHRAVVTRERYIKVFVRFE